MAGTRKPSKRNMEYNQRLVSDPAFKLSLFMHSILSHCYRNQKEERHKAYREAGIPELLAEARTRAKAGGKRLR